MVEFIHPDFLLQNEAGRRLYHEYAEGLPIIDYHCHLNPRDNELVATMAGNFQDGRYGAGKIQFGAGWWFLDQKDGMEKQMNALSNLGLLSRFAGMLTDSRSFLSYPRHEYFRRTLCNLTSADIEKGLLPASELYFIGREIVAQVSCGNAKEYFRF